MDRATFKTGAVWLGGTVITIGLSQGGAPTWLLIVSTVSSANCMVRP
jgi:hypothetical protein